MPLPENFDLVALSRKEVVKIIDCGKNPRRREDDVDARGNATNTLYVGPPALGD